MVHEFDPYIWEISEGFGIRWYGFSYMLGFVLAFFIIRWFSLRDRSSVEPDQASEFITYAALGILVGGRLGYCLFYSPDLFYKFKSSFPFWGVFAVNEGGMASHGGIIGLAIGCMLFARKYRKDPLHLFDLAALTGPIGIFFGRIANFMNGELVGRPADASLPWAIKFPQDILLWPKETPQKLMDLNPIVTKLGAPENQWQALLDNLSTDSQSTAKIQSWLWKIIEAIQKGNNEIRDLLEPLLIPRHPSQIYGALGEGLLLFLILFIYWRKRRRPGQVSSMFIVLYSVIRIADEFYRLPDAHLGYQLYDLTRGQWLSIGMLLFGLILMLVWSLRSARPQSGWGGEDP